MKLKLAIVVAAWSLCAAGGVIAASNIALASWGDHDEDAEGFAFATRMLSQNIPAPHVKAVIGASIRGDDFKLGALRAVADGLKA